jgi:hypothetical protein
VYSFFYVHNSKPLHKITFVAMGTKVATLFTTEIDTLHEGTPGRSERLLLMRDKALSTRYYYYMRYKHYNYIKACEELSNEFYISVIQVQKVLKANTETLQQFRNDQPTTKQLSQLYPHINWD